MLADSFFENSSPLVHISAYTVAFSRLFYIKNPNPGNT